MMKSGDVWDAASDHSRIMARRRKDDSLMAYCFRCGNVTGCAKHKDKGFVLMNLSRPN
jgi:hypothetical protein